MKSTKNRSLVGFAGILVGNLIAAMDAVALSISLPTQTLAESLSTSTTKAYWAGTSFIIAHAVCQPIFPAYSGAFGRRTMMLVGLAISIIGTILCSVVHRAAIFLTGRTLQGIGCGGILSMTYATMADIFDPRHRISAMSNNSVVWLVGTTIGPILDAAVTADRAWRWMFWMMIPLSTISAVLVGVFFPTSSGHISCEASERSISSILNETGNLEKNSLPTSKEASLQTVETAIVWKELDNFGAVLLISSVTSILIPTTWGGIQYSWSSWHTLIPLCFGIVSFPSWLIYEHFIPRHPIVPTRILMNHTFCCTFFGTFALGIIQFGIIFYLPLYYQFVKGYTVLGSSVALLPETLLPAPITVLTAVWVSKTGRYKPAILAGWAITSVGCGLLLYLKSDSTIAQWIFINIAVGLGMGLLLAAAAIASQAPVRNEDMAIASVLTPFIRSIGQAVGIAVGNSILQNILQQRLSTASVLQLRENATLIASNLASPMFIQSFTQQGSDEQEELLSAYIEALQGLWWFLFTTAVTAGVLSLPIRQISLDRDPDEDSSTSTPQKESN